MHNFGNCSWFSLQIWLLSLAKRMGHYVTIFISKASVGPDI